MVSERSGIVKLVKTWKKLKKLQIRKSQVNLPWNLSRWSPRTTVDTTLQGREARSLARFVIPGCPSALSVTCPHVTLRTTETVPISCWGTVDYANVAFLKHFAKKVPPKWLQNGTPKVPTLSLNLTFWRFFFENLQNHDFKLPVGTSMCRGFIYSSQKTIIIRTDARAHGRKHQFDSTLQRKKRFAQLSDNSNIISEKNQN